MLHNFSQYHALVERICVSLQEKPDKSLPSSVFPMMSSFLSAHYSDNLTTAVDTTTCD